MEPNFCYGIVTMMALTLKKTQPMTTQPRKTPPLSNADLFLDQITRHSAQPSMQLAGYPTRNINTTFAPVRSLLLVPTISSQYLRTTRTSHREHQQCISPQLLFAISCLQRLPSSLSLLRPRSLLLQSCLHLIPWQSATHISLVRSLDNTVLYTTNPISSLAAKR